jgi:hypothetical protein
VSEYKYPGIRGPDDEYDAAFDQADRATGRVARWLAIGFPLWLVLLLAIPLTLETGAFASLVIASLLAVVGTELVERLVARPLLARRRGAAGFDHGIARAGRALAIGLIAWAVLIAVFAQAGVENAWALALVPLAIAAVLVELIERALVRPWERRRAGRG